MNTPELVRVLRKFEEDSFIHTFVTASSVMLIELPRYGLEFEFCDGALQSRNYNGYALASS